VSRLAFNAEVVRSSSDPRVRHLARKSLITSLQQQKRYDEALATATEGYEEAPLLASRGRCARRAGSNGWTRRGQRKCETRSAASTTLVWLLESTTALHSSRLPPPASCAAPWHASAPSRGIGSTCVRAAQDPTAAAAPPDNGVPVKTPPIPGYQLRMKKLAYLPGRGARRRVPLPSSSKKEIRV